MAKIFIIEDDVKIRTELQTFLTKYGHTCSFSDDFEQMVSIVLEQNPHLVLLDINLPKYDGYHICREIRLASNVPIIMVTSRDSDMDELMSMHLGADDFVTKPYNTQILLARITSILKRTYSSENTNTLTHKDVTLDLSKGIVSYNGQIIELTKNEIRILHLLMNHQGSIVTRDEIMNDLWQSDEFVDDNTLTVNVNRLRRKLESIGIQDFLITRRGQGYLV